MECLKILCHKYKTKLEMWQKFRIFKMSKTDL